MAKHEPPKSTNIIFSYMPLLVGEPGVALGGEAVIKKSAEIESTIDQLPQGDALACVWTVEEDGTPHAGLVMERAGEIAKHLRFWAEGKPEDWFSVQYRQREGAYALALIPNFRKSSERWRIAFHLKYGYPAPNGGESFLFRPLRFASESSSSFSELSRHLNGKAKVTLIEADGLTRENLVKSFREAPTFEVGKFDMKDSGKTGIAAGYLDAQLDEVLSAAKGR